MSDKSNEYGYVGASPTQASGSNTGVFEVNDVTDLLNNNKWTLQTLDVSYLVIGEEGLALVAVVQTLVVVVALGVIVIPTLLKLLVEIVQLKHL